MALLNLAKKFLSQSTFAVLVIASAAATTAPALAADFDFNGTLGKKNEVLLFDFNVNSDKEVTIFSSSSHEENGFDTILSIWDGAGNLIAQQDDGGRYGSTISNGVSYNYGGLDSYFTQFLNVGSYKASVTAYPNFAKGNNISDGFLLDDRPIEDFSGNWRFHLLNVDQSQVRTLNASQPVPEPGSFLALLAVGAIGTTSMLKRKHNLA